MNLTLEQAQRVLAAALARSIELKTRMNVAVVDGGAHLVAFARQDGAMLGSIDVALKKAKTSRLFDAPTSVLGTMTQPGGEIYNIELTNSGLVTFGGGVPLKTADGTIVGAIGVSGGSAKEDEIVAEAGAAAL